MYPLLQDSYLEEITKNRVYVLARELAKIKGEDFAMPEVSAKYGTFVDNQGTGDIYSSLITRQNWEGKDEAVISIYSCLLYTSPSPRDGLLSRMPSSA